MQVGQSYPVSFLMLPGINGISEYMVDVQLSVLGVPGEAMIGSFGGTFLDNGGNEHSIDGTFKVIRDF